MSDFNWEDMLDEIAASISRPEVNREDGWFTVNDVFGRSNMSRDAIFKNLEKRVKAGELEKMKAYDSTVNLLMNCYRKT